MEHSAAVFRNSLGGVSTTRHPGRPPIAGSLIRGTALTRPAASSQIFQSPVLSSFARSRTNEPAHAPLDRRPLPGNAEKKLVHVDIRLIIHLFSGARLAHIQILECGAWISILMITSHIQELNRSPFCHILRLGDPSPGSSHFQSTENPCFQSQNGFPVDVLLTIWDSLIPHQAAHTSFQRDSSGNASPFGNSPGCAAIEVTNSSIATSDVFWCDDFNVTVFV